MLTDFQKHPCAVAGNEAVQGSAVTFFRCDRRPNRTTRLYMVVLNLFRILCTKNQNQFILDCVIQDTIRRRVLDHSVYCIAKWNRKVYTLPSCYVDRTELWQRYLLLSGFQNNYTQASKYRRTDEINSNKLKYCFNQRIMSYSWETV